MTRDYQALVRYIAERRTMPFAWGSRASDCVSYWCGAVEAMTGANPLDIEPALSWDSEAEAEAVIEGFGGLEEAMSVRLREVPVTKAQRGDAAMVRGVRCVMVFEGDTLVGPGPKGEVRMPRSAAIRAWSATA